MPTHDVTIFLPNEAATLAFAEMFARRIGHTAIIYLHGTLGAGKTTFCRGILRSLGYAGTVKSPTYTLVEPYELNGFSVFHFDLYRVQDPSELEFIGIHDYFIPQAICLIEWPELGSGWLPAADLSCYIQLHAEGRIIKIVANSLTGEKIIEKMKSD